VDPTKAQLAADSTVDVALEAPCLQLSSLVVASRRRDEGMVFVEIAGLQQWMPRQR
jgi:hypothetical protein